MHKGISYKFYFLTKNQYFNYEFVSKNRTSTELLPNFYRTSTELLSVGILLLLFLMSVPVYSQTFVPVVIGKVNKVAPSATVLTTNTFTPFNGVTVRVTNPSTGYNCQTLTQNFSNLPKIPPNLPLYTSTFLHKDGVFYCEMPESGTTPMKIYPSRNWDWLNGVTTFDLVKINSHILGIEPLVTYNRLIAADANLSGLVTTADLVAVKNLILGNTTNIVANPAIESWQFIDEYPLTTLNSSGELIFTPIGNLLFSNTPFSIPAYPWGLFRNNC